MRRVLLIAAGALALAAPACGGKKSDADQVRSTWQQVLKAVSANDATKLCTLISPAAQQQIKAATNLSCADAVKVRASALSPADRAAASHVATRSVTVKGKTATLVYAPTPGLRRIGLNGKVTLTKSGSTWLLSGL
jgi:predicted lipid-binding transport protein (Tim44 family)